jgi:hypothetical protein
LTVIMLAALMLTGSALSLTEPFFHLPIAKAVRDKSSRFVPAQVFVLSLEILM